MQSNLYIKSNNIVIDNLDEIHFSQSNKTIIEQFLKEFKHRKALQEFNLPVDNKILLYGHTGCGKTMTAKAIAGVLKKPMVILNLGGIVSSKLGETAKNIQSLFDKAIRQNAVLFIDEFDAIAKMRDYDQKDSGEMKRLVNTIIQLIDYLPDNVILITATNYKEIIDTAILRRFQIQLEFKLPTNSLLDVYYTSLLSQYPEKYRDIQRIYNVSYAEAKNTVYKELKRQIILEEELKLSI